MAKKETIYTHQMLIAPITVYCDDNQLFETKVGFDIRGMPLLYSVWGETEQESRARAEALVIAMDNYRSSRNTTVHHNSLVN